MSLKKYIKPISWCAGAVLVLWLVVLAISLWVFCRHGADASSRWGQFGDAFGVVNALFSGLALLGIVAALLMQREDIDLQLEEMRESVAAQKAAAEMQERRARIAALAEMLRACEVLADFYGKNEEQPTTYFADKPNPPTKKQLTEKKIPALVEKLEGELAALTAEGK